jgi:DNA-binding beta-propeller fold protein YncE
MKIKLIVPALCAATLAACGGDDNKSNNAQIEDNNAQNEAPVVTPVEEESSALDDLNIECVEVAVANETTVTGTLSLSLIDTYVSGNDFATSSAEIVSYDACSDRLYVVNSEDATIDVLSLADTNSAPSKDSTIDLAAAATAAGIEIGAANSVSAKQGLVAVAIEAATKQDNGLIALYRSDTLALIGTYTAGALPDMVALTNDARYILTANEGEPSADYSNDPEGSVTIVNITSGFDAQSAVVTQVSFAEFNTGGTRAAEMPADVRLAGPAGTSVAQDLEPEYIALNAAGDTAWVALQENNALAIIDVESASVTAFKGLGVKSWNAASGNELDASNKDDGTGEFASYEQLVGLYMPDTLASVDIAGSTYILSANEGDGREYIYETTQEVCDNASHTWDGDDFAPGGDDEDATAYTTEEDYCISFIDEARGGDIADLVDASHPLKDALDDNDQLKRIKVINDVANSGGTYAAGDDIVTFGARSFSIWSEAGDLVYDSGDVIAKQVYAVEPDHFNSTNDEGNSGDNRSDDKGTEPEAIETAQIGDRYFAFVGLERQGGVMVFDITDPAAPVFQSYLNNRDFTEGVCTELDGDECDNDTYNTAAGDLGPESIDYFTRGGAHYIAVGNEVSGTTSVFEISFN